jgi:predicted 3-demethylubiquinone-9 3-methyltransferase (glyoxalase superfamily)
VNKITPFLWFNANAEDAAGFYLSVFPNSSKLHELRATEAGPGPVGSLIAMDLTLDGQQVTFLNGGPAHH